MNNRLILPITGGLGNQIFQLCAALEFRHGREIHIDPTLGKPRMNQRGLPEIFSLELPEYVTIADVKKATNFQSKVYGYMLRTGLYNKSYEKIFGIRPTTRFISKLILCLRYRQNIKFGVNNGVGYDPQFSHKNNLIIGYFQTCNYLRDKLVRSQLVGIHFQKNDSSLRYLEKIAKSKPLVVHYRLGDYKQEQSFGIPDSEYYNSAITKLWNTGKYDCIWVFSDEIDEAKTKFPDRFLRYAFWIEDLNDEPGLALEIMRLGHGYVIANSTFSWWGAQMSYTTNPEVVAPSPWFKNALEPNDLIPSGWMRIQGWKSESFDD